MGDTVQPIVGPRSRGCRLETVMPDHAGHELGKQMIGTLEVRLGDGGSNSDTAEAEPKPRHSSHHRGDNGGAAGVCRASLPLATF